MSDLILREREAWSVEKSNIDESVNFSVPFGRGRLEARYVRRSEDYFIAYLSSQSGCERACRMCHLTATGQTYDDQAGHAEFLRQAEIVLSHYARENRRASYMHFNWMARGEPLLNPTIREGWARLSLGLDALARMQGVPAKFNISTIMPDDGDPDLSRMFRFGLRPTIFYSLYSLDPAFRKRWLPKAMPAETALRQLAEWQDADGGEIVLHWAFIAGENDDPAQCEAIAAKVRELGLAVRFNVVRYNPHDARQGTEPCEAVIRRNFAILEACATIPGSRIVPRVGPDVKASCGMFIETEKQNAATA